MKKILVLASLVSLTMGLHAQCWDSVFFDNSDINPPALTDAVHWEFEPTGGIPPNPNEWRRIYFVHGLGGNKSAWTQAADACQYGAVNFPKRKCETIRFDYVLSTASLRAAADDVRKGIRDQANTDRRDYYNQNPNILNPARAFIIAHSQGGVVSRELMHLDFVEDPNNPTLKPNGQMNYGGVVTIASPLQGAAILNHREWILDMANDACNRLVKGYLFDTRKDVMDAIPDIIYVFKSEKEIGDWLRNVLNNVTENVCKIATDNVMPMFFKDYYKGITSGYYVGADTIKILNRDTNNVDYRKFHKMAFYAVEPDNNIMWRALNWMVSKEPNDVAHFQANDDWELYNNVAKPMIDKFQVKHERYLAEYNASYLYFNVVLGTYGPFAPMLDNIYRHMYYTYEGSIEWEKGLNWLNNVNTYWNMIIGAKTVETFDISISPIKIKIKKEESDGVVLAESAKGLPCATHKPVRIYPNEESTVDVNKGSSHMQVRNDEGLRIHLKALLDGKYDWWFGTAEAH